MGVLENITTPSKVKEYDIDSLKELAFEIRKEVINTVSKTGGHLASSLGVVELTIALLKVFDVERDRIIWDVGHQCYAYKILTRGVDRFRTLRQLGGISGFPKIKESKYDHFGVGHSSTSISAALGQVVARDLKGEKFKVIAVIGDGAMTAGIAFEALNHAGDLGRDLIVVLNDNEMSISKSVGALSSFLSRKFSKRSFVKLKEEIKHFLQRVPHIGEDLLKYAKRGEESLKILFTPGILFEAFKFNYLGPIDGHNIKQLVQIFEQVKYLKGPVLLHVSTKKGKGFEPAEENPTVFHGVGPFDPETGEILKSQKRGISYSKVMGDTLCQLAEKDKKIIAITAAMPEGTGLSEFKKLYPDRFFDVGICEQHAVTFAAGLAVQGFKPVVCIYSTFLQRAYDQIIHDVGLQDLNITFCLDRAGLVGEDGPTHHGQFDLSYLRVVPNMVIMAPKDELELQRMLRTAIEYPHPTAIRYPRGSGPGSELTDEPEPISIGRAEVIKEGEKGVVMAVGNMVQVCREVVEELESEGKRWTLLNVRFVKPLPEKDLWYWIKDRGMNKALVVEENSLIGGFGSAFLEWLCNNDLFKDVAVKRVGLPDKYVEHGKQDELRKLVGLHKEAIKEILNSL